MDDQVIKFCHYYLTKGPKKEYKELVSSAKKNIGRIKREAKEYLRTLKEKCKYYGFEIDFESFCDMLNDYIEKKDSMEEESKKEYLRTISELANIYEIDLREELKSHVSYKKRKPTKEEQDEIFKMFCRYYLEDSNVDKYNELTELSNKFIIDFNSIQAKSINYTDKLIDRTKKLGYQANKDNIEIILNDYLEKKEQLNDNKKSRYLKILTLLSNIYNIDIRSKIEDYIIENNIQTIEDKDTNNINYNPFNNNEYITKMLRNRYENGITDISIVKEPKDKYDYHKIQAEYTYDIINIFLEKINNYATEDINEIFLNILNEDEYELLSNLTPKDLYTFLIATKTGVDKNSIINKLEITDNLYKFIELVFDTTNLYEDNIGINSCNLFNVDSDNEISIYLNIENNKENTIFIYEYIKKCINNCLNYQLNLYTEYGTILYSSKEDLNKKINIINELIIKNKIKIEEPIKTVSKIDNTLFGISYIGQKDEGKIVLGYNEYISYLLEIAYYRVLAKLVITKIKDLKKYKKIDNFINLKNVKNSDFNIKTPLNATYNDIEFSIIKDIVNEHIADVSNTLKIYTSDDKKIKILSTEFQKSIKYIYNILNGIEKKEEINIPLYYL